LKVKIAIGQINPVTGGIRANQEKILAIMKRAERENADLLVFPEMAITGYCVMDMVEDRAFVEANEKALENICKKTKDMAVILGYIQNHQNSRPFNAAAVIQHGEIIGTTQKTLLPNYRYFDDKRYFAPCPEVKPIAIHCREREIKLGVSICEDMWDENYQQKPVEELARRGAEILININASPFYPGRRKERDKQIQRHIRNTGLPFIYANTVGVQDVGNNIIVFDGESLVYDSKGNLISLGKQFEEELIVTEIGETVPEEREKLELPKENREKEMFEGLVFALRDYCQKTGFSKIIEPISGGIDSSLGLAVCVEAMGPENVMAFNLPSRVNSENTKNNAARLAENFRVPYRVIPVEETARKIQTVFEENVHEIQKTVTRENIYARVRGLLMMAHSNECGALLVSNGNETEMALGYVTLYGDMDGGLSLLGDVPKMDVYRLARYVNERYEKEMIPREIFETPPSAELSEDQTDPFDYEAVSPLVVYFLERRKGPSEIVQNFKDKKLDPELFVKREEKSIYERYSAEKFEELVYSIYRTYTAATFKRVQAAPVIAISERAFGTDFREPIINHWDGKTDF
jgi:NAD+ synthase (glutamine-hydrolysing)